MTLVTLLTQRTYICTYVDNTYLFLQQGKTVKIAQTLCWKGSKAKIALKTAMKRKIITLQAHNMTISI